MSPAGMYWGPTLWLRSFCTEVLAGTWKSGQQFIHLLMDKKPFQPQCIFSELFPPMHFMSNCIFSEMKSQERQPCQAPLYCIQCSNCRGVGGLNPLPHLADPRTSGQNSTLGGRVSTPT